MNGLQVVSLDSPVELRQAAAVNFKNFVKYHWVCCCFRELKFRLDTLPVPTLSHQQVPQEESQLQISDAEKV